jgi:hypothetical protein
MFLVQFLLPLYDNAGRRLPHERFSEVREELTARYGGVTAYLRSPAQGTWSKQSGAVDRDEVVMCEVMVEALERGWWGTYRQALERRFCQEEIVIRVMPLERL